MSTQIQVRRDTATDWSNENPTLASGEIGYEIDTGKFKIGDGNTAWSSLEYAKYTDSEAVAAVGLENVLNKVQLAKDGSEDLTGDLSDDQGNTIYDYANQIIPDTLLDYFSGSHDDLFDVGSDDHHSKTTSSEIDLGSLGSYDAGGNSLTNLTLASDGDEDTKITLEESLDEDIVRIYAGGEEIINFDAT